MTEGRVAARTPVRILLATDLSGRGDRALDRSVQLAEEWGAELHVVHALQGDAMGLAEYQGLPTWRRPPDAARLIDQQIRMDIGQTRADLRVHVEEGPVVRVILDVLEREACDFLVLGMGRERTFGGVGRIIDELFRIAPVSVLVVKRRPHGSYRHVLVGADFTPESRRGLEVAAGLFPSANLTLMHAYEMAYRSVLTDTPLGRDFGEMEQSTLRSFLDEAELDDRVRRNVLTLVEHGPPEVMLSAYVMEQGAELTVIGAYERSKLFHVVVGGKGPRIVEATPSDVLVVRAERPPQA